MIFVESVSIAYENVFDDYERVNIKELLAGIPSKNSLEVLAYYMAQTHVKEDEGSSLQVELLKIWIGRLPKEAIQRAADFITMISLKARDVRFNFINNVSVLMLTEYIFENYNNLAKVENLSPKQELDLFKAYLWCSETWTRKQSKAFNISDAKNVEEWAKMLITIQFPFAEVTEWKHFAPQFIKAGYFFAFCEKNEAFSGYLKIFLKEYNLTSADQYLINIFTLYNRKFHELQTPYELYVSHDHTDILNFIRQLTLDVNNFKRSDDFKSIREKPIFEVEPNTFLFLNLNFLIDKFFQGIQFAMANVLIKNKATYKGKIIEKYEQFKSIYAQEFSERIMFYSVIRFMFEKSDYKLYDGESLKLQLKDGEPDFYVRDKAKIYAFEYKDITIDAATKHSFNFEKIKAKLFEKMVSNQDNSSKGITQLVNTIEKINAGKFKGIDSVTEGESIIYPVIVCTDQTLSVVGVNYILNKEFRSILKQRGIADGNIRNLIIIDFDTLVKYQELFNNKTLKINNCFNDYYNQLSQIQSTPFNRLMPFSTFMNGKTSKVTERLPRVLFEIAKKLFKFS
jgi:hypothetical protein